MSANANAIDTLTVNGVAFQIERQQATGTLVENFYTGDFYVCTTYGVRANGTVFCDFGLYDRTEQFEAEIKQCTFVADETHEWVEIYNIVREHYLKKAATLATGRTTFLADFTVVQE